jgi:AcrR family transcriptional regulator
MLKSAHSHSETCRWRRRKEARPGEIMDAALELFAERGYAATRLNEVAARAGVSKGTLYLYFDSKEALFQAVIREMMVPLMDSAEKQAGDFTGDTAELLKDMHSFWVNGIMNSRLSAVPKLIVSEAGNFPELARYYNEQIIQRGTRLAMRILERGIQRGEFHECDVRHVSHVMIAPLVFCAIWQHSLAQIDPDAFEVEPYFAAHLDILLHGLKAATADTVEQNANPGRQR